MKPLLTAFIISIMAMGLSACNDSNAEKAGEAIDETLTDTGNAIEDACENAKEGMNMKDQDC